jgi:hypothetical protein
MKKHKYKIFLEMTFLGKIFLGKNIPWNKCPCSVVQPNLCFQLFVNKSFRFRPEEGTISSET